ncbi:hypothetical protein DUNSADRAFT_13828 [Dunaliella salina]|uniref:Encoded protein n=1 Tax=Dunaliella salina TaxID=3046 RepID=A0ABQ7G8N2_DUNSA|nr:hypothetical protein DUNSADRAFT_13828 [Dunaliella salina]|eukprot:KAF5830945.1 hypothetical protein DUNSADRAFT_13828 [Dunaliella salina]
MQACTRLLLRLYTHRPIRSLGAAVQHTFFSGFSPFWMQAWNQGGLPGIQGQDGRCLLVQMKKGSWEGTIIRKSPEQLRKASQASQTTISKGSSTTSLELQARPSNASSTSLQTSTLPTTNSGVDYYPNGLVAAKEMAVKKNQEIMAKVRASELRRRAAAGIRTDNSRSLYAEILGSKNEGGQPMTTTIAEDENEGNLQNWQAGAAVGIQRKLRLCKGSLQVFGAACSSSLH